MAWLLVAGLIVLLLWTMRDRVKAYKMAAERSKEGHQLADALKVAYMDIESAKHVLMILRSSWRLEEPCIDVSGLIADIQNDGLRAATKSAVELLKTDPGPSS